MNWKKRFEIINEILSSKLSREGKKLTYGVAADYLETSTATYGRWKSGKKAPDGDELERIVKKLDISPQWLLTGEGSPMAEQSPAQPGDREKELLEELNQVRKELNEAQNRIIFLQGLAEEGRSREKEAAGSTARTSSTAAP